MALRNFKLCQSTPRCLGDAAAEVAFRVKIPYASRKYQILEEAVWSKFTPQCYTYMNEEELLDKLTTVFYPSGVEGI